MSHQEMSHVLVSAYLNHITLANLRPQTVRVRSVVLNAFAQGIAPRPIVEATRLDIEGFLARDGLSPNTRRAYRSHIASFFTWAVDEKYLSDDPCLKVPYIKAPPRVPRPLAAEDLLRALDNADLRTRAWLLLMAQGGLRAMEVAGLRPQDVLVTDAGPLLFIQEQKGGGSGTVPAHVELLDTLASLPISDGLWWKVSPHHVSTYIARYLRSLGINATGHQGRHTACSTWLVHSRNDLLAVQRLARHRSISATVGYTELNPVRPAEVVRSVPHLRAV